MIDSHSPAEAALSRSAEPAVPPSATRSGESVASAREKLCQRCHAPITLHQVCDACALPETVRRRNGRTPEERAEAVELSEHSKALESAVSALEAGASKLAAHTARLARFVRNGERGVTCLETKRLRATAIAGAGTGTHQESSDG